MNYFRLINKTSSKVNIDAGKLLNLTIKIGTFPVSVISDAHAKDRILWCVKADNYSLLSVTLEA
jgi:hypothetical protein